MESVGLSRVCFLLFIDFNIFLNIFSLNSKHGHTNAYENEVVSERQSHIL